ncbi:D-2-hydroxyacid dehydrogenase [Clostridium estertheticum]|uniref:D-2-hydroxyacid dehydrogenase n=1 Tax=Clostridium estertheticum TaxID=238834 RepID=UPI001CF5DF9C|nr:D-2-hydroxyacid dehydrogenase [Clostridium estertheticum]MCB2307893.1 D-2-hydroxyacid dehydrogenase [Clostridium estertheticum]MCB2346017.1 D-2-hydroxyacid dehydrogenase [Clostridium estertheticum]MCB2351276.1 D-2-hydroxyacid dehydrogenase [Clostridium estertheticum]WAG44163.1 D-2-hydroxyacid dehydrogenase [Clostridium estertheticum]
MKIVVLDGFTLNPGDLSWKEFEKLGELKVYDRTSLDEIVDRAYDCEIILTNKTPLSMDTLKKLPKMKYIGVLATGYNVVDVKAAKEMGIIVTNTPAYGTNSVAQFVFALLLEICHHVGEHNEVVREGAWTNSKDFCFWNYPMIELAGKTMGIIGMGRIGVVTSTIALAFGMNVLAYNPSKKESLISDTFKYVELDQLYEGADVISLHCPLFEETKGIINKESIKKMKDGVIIINTSRGPLIVEEDLADALNSGKVAGVGLDVMSVEPVQMDNPLMRAKNCLITPHIAWAPKESRERLMNIAVDNLAQFVKGRPINIVK